MVPRLETGALSVANTNRDGTGTLVDVFTAGERGSEVRRVTVNATGTTTDGMVHLFIYDGTSARFWKAITVVAITPSGTTEAFSYVLSLLKSEALLLERTHILRAAPYKAESFHVVCEGVDY